jgi:hypothetical protein
VTFTRALDAPQGGVSTVRLPGREIEWIVAGLDARLAVAHRISGGAGQSSATIFTWSLGAVVAIGR